MASTKSKQASAKPKPKGKRSEHTVRISPRFPDALAERVKEASAMRGQSIAAFVMEAARVEAERVIAEESHWRMTSEEAAKISQLMANPPKINAAARSAAKDLAAHVRIRS